MRYPNPQKIKYIIYNKKQEDEKRKTQKLTLKKELLEDYQEIVPSIWKKKDNREGHIPKQKNDIQVTGVERFNCEFFVTSKNMYYKQYVIDKWKSAFFVEKLKDL